MTIILIIITALISFAAFNNRSIFYRFQFNPYQVVHNKQWYRIISHAFVHADWEHLIFNMIVLFFFGQNLSYYLSTVDFIILYFGAIVVSTLYDLYKYQNDFSYNAIGASGATSAVLFACIFFDPWSKVYIFGIIGIPGIIFALLYLAYSYYMSKKNMDNIGHNAHLYGALFGFLYPMLTKPELINHFFNQILNF